MNNKSVKSIDPAKCNGCGECQSICDVGAIIMLPDEEGFLSPSVNMEKCIQCGKCVEFCPVMGNPTKKANPLEVYACQTKDATFLLEATAGGLFPTLAAYIIDVGGVVYGAVYDENMNVVHIGINSKQDIVCFSGSKYVQSNTTTVFSEVKAALQNGRKVLFSGTPCQVDSLIRFCGDELSANLYTIDVVCYGVPSVKLFRAYLDKLEKKHKAKVTDFRFRDKHTYGWSHTTVVRFVNNKGEYKIIEEPDYRKIEYFRMFSQRDCFRRSCYYCQYNTIERVSDFTTGNFWGIENISNTFDTYKGVSMLLVNTDKGRKLFEKIQDGLIIERRSVEEAIRANDALVKTSFYHHDRNNIYKYFCSKGFSKTIRKFYSNFSARTILYKLYHLKHKILRK